MKHSHTFSTVCFVVFDMIQHLVHSQLSAISGVDEGSNVLLLLIDIELCQHGIVKRYF